MTEFETEINTEILYPISSETQTVSMDWHNPNKKKIQKIIMKCYNPITDEKYIGEIRNLILYHPRLSNDVFDFEKHAVRDSDGNYIIYIYNACYVFAGGGYEQSIYFTDEKINGGLRDFYIGDRIVATINVYNISGIEYGKVACPYKL